MKTRKFFGAIMAVVCLVALGLTFNSCKKLEDDLDGMNNKNDYYSYFAESKDFNYNEAPGYFSTAIKNSVGLDPFQGGDDDKVIEACDACYEELKPKLHGKKGTVTVYKTRHPDGRQKVVKFYDFE